MVNPILDEFRHLYADQGDLAVSRWLYWLTWETNEWLPEHIDHARRVLQKLAAFRGLG